jgi:mannosyl-oligosaccharide alpha-1,2-mannosidase
VSAVLCLGLFYHLHNFQLEIFGHLSQPFSKAQKPIPWRLRQELFPLTTYVPLPSGEPKAIPKIQTSQPQESNERKAWRVQRQQAVKGAFVKSWRAYEKYAWLQDEVTPISGGSKQTFGGWGASLVDSLDSLWILGLEDDLDKAVGALKHIDFTRAGHGMLNVFETTIRYLGGLLSAHDLSNGKYPVLLEKAVQLGDMLYAAFDTPNRMPITRWYWEK